MFNGLVGFKFFDREEYAREFLQGRFITRPADYYSREENSKNPSYDPEEGFVSYIAEIDTSQPHQIFHHLDGKNYVFMGELAKEALKKDNKDINDYLLCYKAPLSNHIFCFAWCYYNDVENIFSNEDVLKELKTFGNYVVRFSVKEFFKKCSDEQGYRLLGGGPVFYSDSLSNHFLIKKERYKNQHEFRFLYLDSDPEVRHHNITKLEKAGMIVLNAGVKDD